MVSPILCLLMPADWAIHVITSLLAFNFFLFPAFCCMFLSLLASRAIFTEQILFEWAGLPQYLREDDMRKLMVSKLLCMK